LSHTKSVTYRVTFSYNRCCISRSRAGTMRNCLFIGNGGNGHNLLLQGSQISLAHCSSYNGLHNFAFKTQNLHFYDGYSYNARISGIIIKGSASVGAVRDIHLTEIRIEGPSETNTAHGLVVESTDAGGPVQDTFIDRLTTKHVGTAVYIWPHDGGAVTDVTVTDADARYSWSPYGDYIVQPNGGDIRFTDCCSADCGGTAFINVGTGNVSLVRCKSITPETADSHGPFLIHDINNVMD